MLKNPLRILCILLFALTVVAQDDDRTRAFQLYKDAKYTEALPLFEKLAAAHPEDPQVAEIHAILVASQAIYLKDPEARKKARVRGRELLEHAQKRSEERRVGKEG